MSKTLILFTAGYPYGNKDEPFLESEIPILAKKFEQIIIFPRSKKNDNIRTLPENVNIDNRLIDGYKNKKTVLFKNLLPLIYLLFSSNTSIKGVYRFWKNAKTLLDTISMSFIGAKRVKSFFTSLSNNDIVVYDYWFYGATLMLCHLKKQGYIKNINCRAHRYDIYDEAWSIGAVPFLAYRIKMLDKVYCVSEYGKNYLENKISKKYANKLNLSYLGVPKPVQNQLKFVPDDNEIVIISCARVIDFKRAHNIPEVLKHLTSPVKWVHFGDGSLFNVLKERIKDLPINIKVELKGHVDNKEVLQYYQNNKVDLFLSLSLSEGLPVSMMEAISYGVPIAATPVCGVPEIVNEKTGILLQPDLSFKQIAKKLETFLKGNKLNKHQIIEFFEENFWAEKNFEKFGDELLSIS